MQTKKTKGGSQHLHRVSVEELYEMQIYTHIAWT